MANSPNTPLDERSVYERVLDLKVREHADDACKRLGWWIQNRSMGIAHGYYPSDQMRAFFEGFEAGALAASPPSEIGRIESPEDVDRRTMLVESAVANMNEAVLDTHASGRPAAHLESAWGELHALLEGRRSARGTPEYICPQCGIRSGGRPEKEEDIPW